MACVFNACLLNKPLYISALFSAIQGCGAAGQPSDQLPLHVDQDEHRRNLHRRIRSGEASTSLYLSFLHSLSI